MDTDVASEGTLDNVFSGTFSRCTRADMYRAWVAPDMYPNEPQPRLSNWTDEDLEMYCGIYNRKGIA